MVLLVHPLIWVGLVITLRQLLLRDHLPILLLVILVLILLIVLTIGYSRPVILIVISVEPILVLAKNPSFPLQLIHEHSKRSDNLDDVLVVSDVLGSLLPLELSLVPLLLHLLLPLFLRLAEVNRQSDVTQDEIRVFLGHSCRFPLHKADEPETGLRDEFCATDLAKVSKEPFELLLRDLRINIPDNQVEVVHTLFKLERLLFEFSLSLLL